MYNARISHWRKVTSEARQKPGEWINTGRHYTISMARQLSSDIRHGRRIKGIMPGEQYEAEWFRSKDSDIMCEVFVRLSNI